MLEKVNGFEAEKQKSRFNFPKFSYSEKLSIYYFLKLIILLSGLLLLAFYLLLTNTSQIISKLKIADSRYIIGIISFAIGFLYALVLSTIFNRLDNVFDGLLEKFRRAKKGAKGENLVFSELEKILDKSKYKVYPNFKIPGEKFDIDAIIVGPKGILMIEVKNLSGNFHFIDGNVYKQNTYKRKCLCKLNDWENPIIETLRHKEVLRKFLEKNSLGNIVPRSAIVMVGAKIDGISDPGVYVIIGVNKLLEYIKGLYDDPRFTKEFCAKIIKYLKF